MKTAINISLPQEKLFWELEQSRAELKAGRGKVLKSLKSLRKPLK